MCPTLRATVKYGSREMMHSRVRRAVALSLGLAACGVGAAALVSRFLDVTNHPVLVLAVFSPYLMPAIPIGAIAMLIARRRAAAACAGVLTLAALVTQLPTPAESSRDPGVSVRVMSVNTLQGRADARAVVQAARDADVLSVQELTPSGLLELSANGVDAAFTYRIVKPSPGGSGAGLWSRHPLRESPDGEFEGLPIIARIDLAGAATAPTVAVVHLSSPWPWPIDWWRSDIARATQVLAARRDGPVIAAGDFNSTRDMKQFRRLLGAGFASAGRSPTYRAGTRWPPLLTIDHILTRDCSSTSARTVTIAGSDHRAVLATVRLPR
jgi:endonuclease/exonuclease/phosphatase (EEP) superfamily protein YafD